jgi:hypothetical protein
MILLFTFDRLCDVIANPEVAGSTSASTRQSEKSESAKSPLSRLSIIEELLE